MSAVTLEQVEALAMQLPASERLKLAARLCEQVGSNLPEAGREASEAAERKRQEVIRLADQLLAEMGQVEDESQGMDTAEIIRRSRDERIAAICQNDAPRQP
jgi:hypothetical protein